MVLRLARLLATLLAIASVAAVLAGLVWAWRESSLLEVGRGAALALVAGALLRVPAGALEWMAERWGNESLVGDGPFVMAFAIGIPGALFLGLLGMPATPTPEHDSLETAQAIAGVLSLLSLGMAGVAVVLAMWASSMSEYLLGQFYIQAHVLPVFACFGTICYAAGEAARQAAGR